MYKLRVDLRLECDGHEIKTIPNVELSEGEVAELLGCGRNNLCMARKANRPVPRYRIEGKRSPVYRLPDVVAFARKHMVLRYKEPKGKRG